MALALPGMIKSFANAYLDRDLPVIGVGFGTPGTKDYDAAALSIDHVPDQPVIINELTGQPYMGADGFGQALGHVHQGELPPPKPRVDKPAKFDIINVRNGE